MGRHPLPAKTVELAGIKVNPRLPFEDPAEGCPGGWYRSRFVESLRPYMRSRTEHGGRNSNPLLDRTDDELLIQLVLVLEREQDQALAHREEQASGNNA